MTVKELRELLEMLPAEMEVMAPYADAEVSVAWSPVDGIAVIHGYECYGYYVKSESGAKNTGIRFVAISIEM